jgi:hypothetical protein
MPSIHTNHTQKIFHHFLSSFINATLTNSSIICGIAAHTILGMKKRYTGDAAAAALPNLNHSKQNKYAG